MSNNASTAAPAKPSKPRPKSPLREARSARRRVAQAPGAEEIPAAGCWHESVVAKLDFETTDDLEVFEGVIEQERAVRALDLGLAINRGNYNIFISGYSGTGRSTVLKNLLSRIAPQRDTPPDWVYVNDFENMDRPFALPLPAGRGCELRADIEELVRHVIDELPEAFHAKEHQGKIQRILNAAMEAESTAFGELNAAAEERGFTVKSTKGGLATIPVVDGEPLSSKELSALPAKQRRTIERRRLKLEPLVSTFIETTREIRSKARKQVEEAQSGLGAAVVKEPIRALRRKWRREHEVVAHIAAIEADVIKHIRGFLSDDDDDEDGRPDARPMLEARYAVNVFVDHSKSQGAPVVFENHPTFYNLFGKLEKRAEQGIFATDVTMIRAGAVAQASGGYLVLHTADLFRQPLVWDNLKAVLRNREVAIEDMAEQVAFVPTTGIRPKPIPVDLKLILIGSPEHWFVLFEQDPDFRKYFQIRADFDDEIERDEATEYEVARFVATSCRKQGLRPVERAGVAEVVEQASRLVGDQRRLTLRFNDIANLLIEANHQAKKSRSRRIQRKHVQRALRLREELSNLYAEKLLEAVVDDQVMVATTGEAVGQINGLAVYQVGDRPFGKAIRITATTFSGQAGIVNVEREARLGGSIHNKGVHILHGWLGSHYAQRGPLALTANLTVEQSYGPIDGDSASSAELYAIISSLADVPIRQDLAVTGSLDQRGHVQAIGGANVKIEGFFDLCQRRGLTRKQGVVVPRSNLRNLMLDPAVRHAIDRGRFHVYAVDNIDTGIELLTGMPAQEVHARAMKRLVAFRRMAGGGRGRGRK